MPKLATKARKLSPEELDLLDPIVGEVQPEDLEDNRGGYERWMSRYASFEVIFRHQRRGQDPGTGDLVLLGGRRVKFSRGVAYLPKEDPDYERMRTVLKRTSDFIAGNLVCVDEKMAEGLMQEESDIAPRHLNQGDEVPLMEMGIHPSMHAKIQKVLDKRRRLNEAPLQKRLKELEAENKRLKAVKASSDRGDKTPPPPADLKQAGDKAEGDKVQHDGDPEQHTEL